MIAGYAPEGFNRVFFTNGGADANEHAVRMARLTTGRPKVLSTYRSYHGATASAMAMTGDPRRWASDTATYGVVHFFGPYAYRSAFHADGEAQESERALQHLTDVITLEGPTRSRRSSWRRSSVRTASWFRPRLSRGRPCAV